MAFYGDVIQHLKAWTATPPKLREAESLPAHTAPALVSTVLSSQDGAEPADENESQTARCLSAHQWASAKSMASLTRTSGTPSSAMSDTVADDR